MGHIAWDYIIQHYSKRRIIDKHKTITLKEEYISPIEKETMKESLLKFANNISEKI